MKALGASAPIDVLVDSVKFPEYDIVHIECFSNADIDSAGMFDLKDTKF